MRRWILRTWMRPEHLSNYCDKRRTSMSTEKPKMFESLVDFTVPVVSDSIDRSARYRAEDRGGHAIHFLKRLDRASGAQAELALQLYNDPEALRFVLHSITIPEEFDRVAVSLHDADQGPYLVASRKGRFVTCLGEGMTIDNLYLINHSRLLTYIEKNEEYRRRSKLAESLVGEKHQMKKLFARIASKGDDVTREEMLAISAMQPALKLYFIDRLLGFISNVSDSTRVLIRRKRFTNKDRSILKKHYGEYRAIGHLALLASMSGPSGLDRLTADKAGTLLDLLVRPLFTGDTLMLFRLVWFVGKMGKIMLPALKRMLIKPRLHEEWALALMGLIVVGVRHGKTRGKVFKILEGLPGAMENYGWDVIDFLNKSELKNVLTIAVGSLMEPDKSFEYLEAFAREQCFEEHQPFELPALYTWEKETDVPKDLAFASVADGRHCFSETPELLSFCLTLTPWLARCEAEDFYYPHDYYRHVRMPWQPEETIILIEQERKKRKKKKPVKTERTPERNDPCPCGSGKKYKRCCLLK